MIRYYFGSKEGLFETMLRETLDPMKQQLRALAADSNQKNFLDLSIGNEEDAWILEQQITSWWKEWGAKRLSIKFMEPNKGRRSLKVNRCPVNPLL